MTQDRALFELGFAPRPLLTPKALQTFMGAEFALSPQQFAAVSAPLAPAVVIAGAGSGKTTLMAARVVWLVGTGQVRPDEILGLTFTTKAAGELATRVRHALFDAGILPRVPAARLDDTDESLEPTVATYNAYAASLLTEHGLRIGHEPDTRVIAEGARYQLAARVVARHTRNVQHLSDHPQTVIGYLLSLDSSMGEHLVDPGQVLDLQDQWRPRLAEEIALESRSTYRKDLEQALFTFDRREELLHLVAEYRALKRHLGLMEFSDQIELGARLAQTRPEVGAVERSKYRVVLLDEYQDTSVAQALMLSRLFSGPDVDHGRGHPVTAVGDPNQAIYGWRGASVSNILRFGESFPESDGSPEVTKYSLTVNRRSDRRILELANHLAAPLYQAFPGVAPLEAPRDAQDGEIGVEVFETYRDELAWLAGSVKQARERFGAWSSVGILTRDNAHAADVFRALSEAEVPVEIVGLKGLLELPEVAEVVATLTLLQDLTANSSLLTLLNGPRWVIGPRDLALLGRRANELAGAGSVRGQAGLSVEDELEAAVAGSDPTEVASLSDALDSPGEAAYSPEALQRFALLAEELRRLRQYAGEPLVDLVRRIIDTCGIDVELAASVSPAAVARRDNLDLFVKGVADFQAIDGEVSLTALLSYLEAEDEGGSGLDVATPTASDTVKLLTVHRAKGLEWDAVFLVGVAKDKFPTGRTRTKWTAGPGVLPTPLRGDHRDLPMLAGPTPQDFKDFAAAGKTHELAEELRLGYVAFTRPRHHLSVSSYVWSPTRVTPSGASPYQVTARDHLLEAGLPVATWPEDPVKGTPNPLQEERVEVAWPVREHTPEVLRRLATAELVNEQIGLLRAGRPPAQLEGLDAESAAIVADWDAETERLVTEARSRMAEHVRVPLPGSLSVSAMSGLRDDPEVLAATLARPMPREPSPAARFGTRFHAWVAARFEQAGQDFLVDPDELSGRADLAVDGDDDLASLVAAFEKGPFAQHRRAAVEQPFAIVLAGQVVRGRIDAVFTEDDGSLLIVDWKTNRRHDADPLQLALYRLAWAELCGVPLERVRAGFYYVRDGELVLHHDLPERPALEAMLAG